MLLGSWAHPQGASHILDIGTGETESQTLYWQGAHSKACIVRYTQHVFLALLLQHMCPASMIKHTRRSHIRAWRQPCKHIDICAHGEYISGHKCNCLHSHRTCTHGAQGWGKPAYTPQTQTRVHALTPRASGTGVLALMAAQRAPPAATIHAIDIDQHACAQAARNAAASPFAANVSVFHCALQDLVEKHLVEMQGCPPASPCGAACGGQAHASACGCSGAATNALPDAPPAPSTVYSDAPDVAPFMGEPSSSVRGKDSDNVDGRGGDGDGGRNRGGGIGAGSGRVESPLEHRGAPCIVHEPSAWALPRGGYDMVRWVGGWGRLMDPMHPMHPILCAWCWCAVHVMTSSCCQWVLFSVSPRTHSLTRSLH